MPSEDRASRMAKSASASCTGVRLARSICSEWQAWINPTMDWKYLASVVAAKLSKIRATWWSLWADAMTSLINCEYGVKSSTIWDHNRRTMLEELLLNTNQNIRFGARLSLWRCRHSTSLWWTWFPVIRISRVKWMRYLCQTWMIIECHIVTT